MQKKKKTKNYLQKLTVITVVGYLVYIIALTHVANFLLRHFGTKGRAVFISETSRVRYHKATLYYVFSHRNNQYTNNSLEEDLSKVGDSIDIVYLKTFPSINRPVSYFENDR